MEKRAKQFLELSGNLYNTNKEKWSKMLPNFDEDIYNETIIKVYESILKGADTEGDLVGYWFKSFKNNLNRKKEYLHYKNRTDEDPIDILKERETEENTINLYYTAISNILSKVMVKFDRKTFEVYRMYLLCNMSYEQLDKATGLKDSKERINKVKKWVCQNMKL